MLDLATRKIGDRWFFRFAESDIAVNEVAELEPEVVTQETDGVFDMVRTGLVKVWMNSGSWKVRTPVKAEPIDPDYVNPRIDALMEKIEAIGRHNEGG